MITFAQPWFLLLLLFLPLLAWLKGRHGHEPAFLYSSVQLVKGISALTRSQAGRLLPRLRWLILALLIIALARPQLGEGEAKITAELLAAQGKPADIGTVKLRFSMVEESMGETQVKATTQDRARPTAVQIPISRTGRMGETASAANPSTAATLEAVTGRNLFASARIWCSSTGTPSG